jgi:hypothetical protein
MQGRRAFRARRPRRDNPVRRPAGERAFSLPPFPTDMYRFARPALGLALLSTLAFTAGCDSGAADDFDALLADARIARQSGDLAGAIGLYEDALRLDPASAVTRTELASTHLEQADVDLLDLSEFVDFLTDAAGSAAQGPTANAHGGCGYASDPTATVFDPRDVVNFEEVFAHRDVIQLAVAILQGGGPVPGNAVIPAGITTFNVCTGIQDGQIVMDRDAALAAMSAQGLTDQQIASALAVDALSRFIDAYFFLTVDVPQQTTWYRLADGSIGVCADDADQLRVDAEDAVQGMGRGLAGLDLRAYALDADAGDPVRQLVDDAVDAYTAVEDDLAPYCTL